MMMRLQIAVLLTAGIIAVIPGIRGQCSNLEIENSWEGNYKADFKTDAPEDFNGMTLKMTFSDKVDSIDIWDLSIVSNDDTHYEFHSDTLSGNKGDPISISMIVHHSGPQPLPSEITMNGIDVCGEGGGFTPEPPLDNPCDPSGSGKEYDYEQALCMSILFYEAQRSGKIPDDQRLTWRHDSAMDDGQDVGHDLTGGYYDAGDHVKFGFPMAFTTTCLAWGVATYGSGYEQAGQLDYARDAVKYATDYFLKAHTDASELYGQVGNGGLDHAYWGRPEEMPMERPSAKIDTSAPGSDLAGETAAALAAASIVFKDVDPAYSTECLNAAMDLYSFAEDHHGIYSDSITDAAGYYRSWSGYNDELVWGAAWLAKATGDDTYLTKAKNYFDDFDLGGGAEQFSWDDKRVGVYALLSEIDGGSKYTSALSSFLSGVRANGPFSPGGMVYLDQWGSLRHAANVAYIALRAVDLGIDAGGNREFAMNQINYILGSNGRSFLVGFGVNPPERPHHRASSCPPYPGSCDDGWAQNQDGPNPHVLYGALVGGPDQNDQYTDDRNDYVHNEVACDYNACLVGALAAIVAEINE